MNSVIEDMGKYGIIPVVKIDNYEDAQPLARALIAGGLPVAEITFRTGAAAQSIRMIHEAFPEMLLGAGTVLSPDQAEAAVKAGALFIVSPGYNQEVVSYCLDNGVPVVPGINNPTQLEQAIRSGLDVVKFFPAEASGGLSMIKSIAPVYPQISFMPTGGINIDNIGDYLAYDRILGCGGTWMVKPDWINLKKFGQIEAEVKKAVLAVHGFEFAHIGIHTESPSGAEEAAGKFEELFGFESKTGNSSIFSTPAIEIVKSMYLNEQRHIAVRTNSIPRAVYYFSKMGIGIREQTIKKNGNKVMAVYLDTDIAGYPIHLLQRT